jgi:hypothetical protein
MAANERIAQILIDFRNTYGPDGGDFNFFSSRRNRFDSQRGGLSPAELEILYYSCLGILDKKIKAEIHRLQTQGKGNGTQHQLNGRRGRWANQ